MKTLNVAGVELAYLFDERAGPNAPVLVFSNSLGARWEMWDGQCAVLGEHYRILRYDPRGHGRSSQAPVPFTIADLGRDVVALLDELALDRVAFCGLSMGGLTGQWLGLHAPERLTCLALCNTGAKIGDALTWDTRIAAVLSGGMASLVDAIVERWFTAGFRLAQGRWVESVREGLVATPAAGYASCCAAIRDADFRDLVRGITVPTLVIAGTFDPATPPGDGRFLAERIRDSVYLELPTAHLSNIEDAKSFNEALATFLRGHHG